MHILVIPSEEYIPEYNPIAGIFQHDQARILVSKGHKVGALSFTFRYSFSTLFKGIIGNKTKHTKCLRRGEILKLLFSKLFFPKDSAFNQERIDKINVIRCDGFWGFKSSTSENAKLDLWNKYGVYALKRYIKLFGTPDVIHAHNMIYAGLFTLNTKQIFNIPIVVTEHSSQYAMKGVTKDLFKLLQSTFEENDNIFAVSPSLIQQLTQKFSLPKDKINWLPNVLDLDIEKTELSEKQLNDDVFRFINIANLIPLKGQKELIEAFDIAFKGEDNVELIIAGKGILEQELKNLIDKLGLNRKVKLIGLINRNEVVRYIDDSDVLVLPSHYETFGVVLIEALSRGVPVISTYCGGPECIVNEKNGILVETKSVDQLKDSLLYMLNNKYKYDTHYLRKSTLLKFGKENFYKSILNIYASINT